MSFNKACVIFQSNIYEWHIFKKRFHKSNEIFWHKLRLSIRLVIGIIYECLFVCLFVY